MADEVRTVIILDKGRDNFRSRPVRPDMVQRPISEEEVAALERLQADPRFQEMMDGVILRPSEENDDVFALAGERVKAMDDLLDGIAETDGVWLSDDIGIGPDYTPQEEDGRTVISVCLHLFCGKVDVGPVDGIGIGPGYVTVTSGPLMLTVERETNSFQNGNSCCKDCNDSD